MTAPATFVPSSEAAFIAGLTDRQMNRVFDEHLVPDMLVRADNGRTFARLAAAFAGFYFEAEPHLAASLRREVLAQLTERVVRLKNSDRVFALTEIPPGIDWQVSLPFLTVDVTSFVKRAWERAQEMDRAEELVTADADTMGGVPVFAKTRVPVETVLASMDAGLDFARVKASYPFLTQKHIDAARVYVQVHPKRGRPRRLAETNPNWVVKQTRVVRKAGA